MSLNTRFRRLRRAGSSTTGRGGAVISRTNANQRCSAMLTTETRAAAYQLHRRELVAYATRLVVRPEVAEELVQDAAVRLLGSEFVPTEPAEVRAWLFKVVTNLAIDHLRRHSSWRELVLVDTKARSGGDEAFITASPSMRGSPEPDAITREPFMVCFSCTPPNLAPFEAAALLLKEVYGFSTRETAFNLDVTE